jgi:hypothetical protein
VSTIVSPGAAMASGSGVWAEALKTDADDKSRANAAFRTIGIIKSMVLAPKDQHHYQPIMPSR